MKERGHWAERKVAQDRRQRLSEKILLQNWKGPYGELDLVTQSRSGEIYIIEVKCRSSGWSLDQLISEKQLRRLQLNQRYLEDRSKRTVHLLLGYVSVPKINIEYFEL